MALLVPNSRAGQDAPNPDPQGRTYHWSGRDTFTGPDGRHLRGNGAVQNAGKDVRMFNVTPHNRGWFRGQDLED